ncbi:Uncharacterised protein [uncultured archaeon]|nr:Uncharacterised protein [uncultured archaeon]
MIFNVAWRGDDGSYKPSIPDVDPQIVWGNNSVEALSTLIASKLKQEPDDVAKVLEAFNYELLAQFDAPDGIAKLEEILHERTFSSFPGGIEYVINYPSTKDGKGAPDTTKAFPGTIGKDLAELNLLQRQLDDAKSKLSCWQWEAYSTWYKFILSRSDPFKERVRDIPQSEFENIIDSLARKINDSIDQIKDLQSKITGFSDKISNSLKENLPGYTLDATNRNRFWQPNDPVLLFSGEGVSRSFRHGYDDQYSGDGTLNCRSTGNTVTGLTIQVRDKTVTITEKELLSFCSSIPIEKTPVPSELKSMIAESMLLDTNQARLMAIAAFELAQIADPTDKDIEMLSAEIEKIQTILWNACLVKNISAQRLAEASGLVGSVPNKISIQPWSQAWIPLYIEWDAYILDYKDIKSDFSNFLSDWKLGDIHYECISDSPGNKEHYARGSVVITPHAGHKLQSALRNYIDKLDPAYPELQELRDICDQLGKLDVLSQTLSGFNNSQIMRKETLQFPVFDIPGDCGGSPEFAGKVADLVGDNNKLSPSPEISFNPIRAGFMKLMRLWLVDAFGQIKEIDVDNNSLISKELTTPASSFNNYVTLKPAIVQPARLNFQWISADESMVTNSDPASNPVCGWLLPNHIENSLMIFSSDGFQLGKLQIFYSSDNTSEVHWVPKPNSNITPENIQNAQLRKFVQGLKNFNKSNGEALIEFIKSTDETLSSIDPLGFKNEQSLSVLTGRPLALVNAGIGLEIEGLLAFSQSWDDLGKFNSYSFEKVEFTARLGDISQICDGLLGYFIKNGDDTYKTFYATSGIREREQASGYVNYDHTISINATEGYDQIKLALIVDPLAGVHITTGILPVVYKEIPLAYISSALGNMDITFSMNPIIITASKFGIPLPAVDGSRQWSWIYHPNLATWTETTDFDPVSPNASFKPAPKEVVEGWLRLTRKENK